MRTPAEAFWQDLFLLVPALALAFLGRAAEDRRDERFPITRAGIAIAATLLGMLFAWKAPDLPLDNVATRLGPGSSVADLCNGRNEERLCLNLVIPELEEGEHMVVLADLADPAFGAAVESLNALARTAPGRRLWVLTDAPQDEQYAFFWRWGPTFEIREAPHALLRPLYRRMPRSFIVLDGEVAETISGLPPETLSHRSESEGR